MKKLIHRSLSLVLALVMALTLAVPAMAAPPTDITVEPQTAFLAVGESLTLTAALTPEDADPTGLVWYSDAPQVASVTQEGVVTALSVGTAFIGYHIQGQPSPASGCQVTVTEQTALPSDPANDQLVLSDTHQVVQVGQYQTKVLTAPDAAVKNGETDVSANYTLTYAWTQDGQPLAGAETTLVTPAFQEVLSLTCTVTAVSTEDPARILTADCTYRLEVLPGTMIEGVSYAADGPQPLTAIYDLEGTLSLMDQLTQGIEGSLETPAIDGLKRIVFYPETVTGADVGTLNVTANTIYSLSDTTTGEKFSDVVFTPAMEGTYTISFMAYGNKAHYGQLTISVSGQTAPGDGAIRCTSSGFTFAGSDFTFDNTTDPVVAVTFGQPAVGSLLRDFTKGSGIPAAGTRFYMDSSAYGDYHVSTLTYLPSPGYTGLVNLPVTYHTRSGKAMSQTILVQVISKTSSDHFLDVTPSTVGTWAANSIDFAYHCGLINGVGANTFAPGTAMTRAMLVTVLYRAAGSPQVTVTTNFTDLIPGGYYYDAVLWANALGVVNGVDDTHFSPDLAISRQQIATILYRYAKASGTFTPNQGSLEAFADRSDLDPYAVEPMAWAVGEGIISGTTNDGITTILSPQSQATRAQVAVML
ncbi:MAG: S-layer homology domain-containing protein, partial [Ruminiclostridium sp.]|nr:S-layer homology domain-containing protein [Ruminiclostridium sp.]